jgi:hypothetical protein
VHKQVSEEWWVACFCQMYIGALLVFLKFKGSRYGTETSIAGTSLRISLPCSNQLFWSLEEQQTSTTTASVDVEIWEKQGISNTQSIDLGTNTASTSSEDDSTGLPLA